MDSPFTRYGWLLRWLPFLVVASCSVALAAIAPDGRKAFHIDWSLSTDALALSISKLPHIGATALVAVLAVVATGRHRWALALVLALLVGWGWELAQTTVLGRTARLADLAPDTLGGMLGCAWGTCAFWLLQTPASEADRS